MDSDVIVEISSHWSLSLGVAGIYLLLMAVVKINDNLVDCDVLLDESYMSIGHGLAYSDYYGFLKIILPPGPTEKGMSKCKIYALQHWFLIFN